MGYLFLDVVLSFIIVFLAVVFFIGLFACISCLIDGDIEFFLYIIIIIFVIALIIYGLFMLEQSVYQKYETEVLNITEEVAEVPSNYTFSEFHTFERREIYVKDGILQISFNSECQFSVIEKPKLGDVFKVSNIENFNTIYYLPNDDLAANYTEYSPESLEIRYIEDGEKPYADIFVWEDGYSKHILYIPISLNFN